MEKHIIVMSIVVKTITVLFMLFIQHINGNIPTLDSYTAGVVEYNAVEYPIHENVAQNEQNHEKIMEEAKRKGAEIIVFPEYSLLSLLNEVDVSFIPNPNNKISPCDEEITIEAIRKLSCAARLHQLYTVLNVAEKVDCTTSYILECKENHEVIFNTNIVFDRNGTVIARHRKYHRFAEDIGRPLEPEVTYFDTDFGVRFGVLTCFEILFEYPGRTLVEDLGIKNIIILTAWSASLPYHMGTQAFSGWAYRYNVNLLVAGLNNPRTGSSGTGLFRGKYEILENIVTDAIITKLLVGKLYKEVDGPNLGTSAIHSGESEWYNDLSVLGALEDGSHELIRNDIFRKVLCHRELCCHFDVSHNVTNKNSFYRAYVFDGVADFQGMATGGTQSCLVIFCSDKTINSCVRRSLSGGGINYLTISGNFRRNHTLQIPSSVMQESSLALIQPVKFNFTVNCHDNMCRNVITMLQPTSKLIVFGIYGRDYTKDGLPPDKVITDFERSRRTYRRRRRRRRRRRGIKPTN